MHADGSDVVSLQTGTHEPWPVLLPWPQSVFPLRWPILSAETLPLTNGDCDSDVIALLPVNGVVGTNL